MQDRRLRPQCFLFGNLSAVSILFLPRLREKERTAHGQRQREKRPHKNKTAGIKETPVFLCSARNRSSSRSSHYFMKNVCQVPLVCGIIKYTASGFRAENSAKSAGVPRKMRVAPEQGNDCMRKASSDMRFAVFTALHGEGTGSAAFSPGFRAGAEPEASPQFGARFHAGDPDEKTPHPAGCRPFQFHGGRVRVAVPIDQRIVSHETFRPQGNSPAKKEVPSFKFYWRLQNGSYCRC